MIFVTRLFINVFTHHAIFTSIEDGVNYSRRQLTHAWKLVVYSSYAYMMGLWSRGLINVATFAQLARLLPRIKIIEISFKTRPTQLFSSQA